ncbi:hypothetical protein ASC85_08590 [Pseudomonas sp. Root401]|nr:hypothetical protein ASC85_08590 [Pseudomonas sp. Root401]
MAIYIELVSAIHSDISSQHTVGDTDRNLIVEFSVYANSHTITASTVTINISTQILINLGVKRLRPNATIQKLIARRKTRPQRYGSSV